MLLNVCFGEVWLNQEVGNEKLFLTAFKQRIGDTYLQTWNQNINNNRKSILYKEIPPYVYLRHIKIIKHRIALTHFRTRNDRLFVETGSWGSQTVPYEERHCAHCNSRDIEDEYHFLLICTRYSELRNKYILKYYRCRPSVYKICAAYENRA